MEKAYGAAMRARKSDQMIANVEHYKNQLNQTKLEITTDNDTKSGTTDLKKAGAILSGFINSVNTFSKNETDRKLMIKARSKAVKDGKISEFIKNMKKVADGLEKAEMEYKAKANIA